MKGMKTLLGSVVAASMLAATPAWAAAPVVQYPHWFKIDQHKEAHVRSADSKQSRSVTKIPRELKEALEKLQQKLPELKGLHIRAVLLREESTSRPEVWEFSLSSKEKGNRYDGKSINATVAINAETLELYRYNYANPEWTGSGEISEEKAKEKADEFVKKILGSKKKEYEQKWVSFYEEEDDEEEERSSAVVGYIRKVNDIPLANFDLHVEVDAEGHVTSFFNEGFAALEKVKFPNPKKALSKENAEKEHRKLVDMSLIYLYDWEKDRPVLAYEPDFYGPVDAFTGKKSPDLVYFTMDDPKRIQVDGAGNPWVIRSRQDAETLLKQVFKIPVEDLELEDEIESDEDEPKESRMLTYIWESKDKPWGWVELVVYKESGKLRSFYSDFDRDAQSEPKVKADEAVQIATDTLEQFFPQDKKEIQLTYMHDPYDKRELPDWVEEDEDERKYVRTYSLSFNDLYQNIPVGYSSYHVAIDPATGSVTELQLEGVEKLANLPDPVKTVSPEEAKTAMQKYQQLTLIYMWPRYMGYRAPGPVLLYTPEEKPFWYIDAFTGNVVEFDMEEDEK